MKILHVAVFTPTSTNIWQADAFEVLGHEVIRYDYRKIARTLGDPGKRDDDIINTCKKEKPDIILFSKCNTVHKRVIEECSLIGKTVFWYMDDFHNLNKEVEDKMLYSDLVFCSTRRSVDLAKTKNAESYRLTGGFDPKVYKPHNIPKTKDVLFIGSMHSIRPAYQKAVGFPVANGFYGEAHSHMVSQTKINLNFTEGDGVSNRIYKIMGAGGFLLTTPWDEMEEDFVAGKHLGVFNTTEELKEKIEFYLRNDGVREIIAKAGRRKVLERDNINYARVILEKCNL